MFLAGTGCTVSGRWEGFHGKADLLLLLLLLLFFRLLLLVTACLFFSCLADATNGNRAMEDDWRLSRIGEIREKIYML